MLRFFTIAMTPLAVTLLTLFVLGADSQFVIVAGCLGFVAAILLNASQYRRQVHTLRALAGTLKSIEESLEAGDNAQQLNAASPVAAFEVVRKQTNSLSLATSKRISKLLSEHSQLEQTKMLFEGILETMIEGVLVLDSTGRILYSNQAARHLLNSDSRDIDHKQFWEVVRNPELQEEIEAALEIEAPFRKEYTLSRSKSVVEVSASRLSLHPNPGLVVVLHNVTELRRLEHMRREFVSNVSHELKTPLTSIQAYADTLLDGALEDAENGPVFVERILEQSDRLQQLIQDMLRLARIESQSDAFASQPVSIGTMIVECVDARTALAEARHVLLSVEDGNESLQAYADPEGLRTIIENLVTNALNYTLPDGRVDTRWYSRGNSVVIEVQDDGIGIAAEHKGRIFERFYRVDAARSRGMGGTGLGLAIVKHLTNLFGGSIEVESEVGQGTLFRVSLPLVQESHIPTVQ